MVEVGGGSERVGPPQPPPSFTTLQNLPRQRPMRPEGLEPPRVAPPAPKAGASANSATVASFGEMYLSRVLLSSLSIFWSLSMVRTRSSIVLAVALCAAVFTRPATGQASQDKDKICSQVQNRTLAVGTWATYTWTGGSTNGSTMRMAVVGKEPQEGTTYYWYEVSLADPHPPRAQLTMQLKVMVLGASRVPSIVTPSGDHQAMQIP